jgi:farnesyl-diphosphate farnesyltransferase
MNIYKEQQKLLPGVSRTFALTIPMLPKSLCPVVTNAYLLCRIADTIEDDQQLSADEKNDLQLTFIKVLEQQFDASIFSKTLLTKLSIRTPIHECQLIQQTPMVIDCLHSFTPTQQASIIRCVNIMAKGMSEFARHASLDGLENMAQLDRYCYCVAGVVGEMLTELFCDYTPQMNQHKTIAMQYAINFGQGLQMTNILQDIWTDRSRGVSWLPKDQSIEQLILIAYQHLQKAIDYVNLIPAQETKIKSFAIFPIGLALLTLTNIHRHPDFTERNQIKISRAQVKALMLITPLASKNQFLTRQLFSWLSRPFRTTKNNF